MVCLPLLLHHLDPCAFIILVASLSFSTTIFEIHSRCLNSTFMSRTFGVMNKKSFSYTDITWEYCFCFNRACPPTYQPWPPKINTDRDGWLVKFWAMETAVVQTWFLLVRTHSSVSFHRRLVILFEACCLWVSSHWVTSLASLPLIQ